MRISLCMIVKNEEKNLNRCLNSVAGAVDEIIVVDTGSTDNTCQIARDFNAQVEHFKWNCNFSDARNKSLEIATGDWVLFLDADEELAPESVQVLRRLVEDENMSGYFLRIENYLGDEGFTEICPDMVFRLFRNRPEYRFQGAVHEQIVNVILENQQAKLGIAEELVIRHYGYLNKQIAEKDKKNRNLAIIEEQILKNPEDKLLRYHYGVELYRAGNYEQAAVELTKAAEGLDTQIMHLPKLLRYIVLCYYAEKKYDNALEISRQGLKLYPQYADLHYYQGLIFYEQKEYGLAYTAFTKALATPKQPSCYASFSGTRGFRTYYYLGQIAEVFCNEEEALRNYILSLRDNTAFMVSLDCIARILQPNDDPDYAKEALEKICEFASPKANLCMGEILLNQAAYQLALEYFENAGTEVEEFPEIKLKKAICLMQQRRFLEAIRAFDGFGPGHSLYPIAKFNKLFCFWLQGNRQKVRQLSEELAALDLAEDSGNILYLLKNSMGKRKYAKVAVGEEGIGLLLDVLKRTLDLEEGKKAQRLLDGLRPDFLTELGMIIGKLYFDYGHIELAEQYLRLYVANNAESENACFMLGQIAERQGRYFDAGYYYRQALSLDPKNPRYDIKLIQLYERMRQAVIIAAIAKYPEIQAFHSLLEGTTHEV